jgi:predicted MFS family arabinose efflux permease
VLVAGAGGFGLLATETSAPFVVGALLAFALGWGWPGLFNLAVVDSHREAPGAATGVSQTGIYLGAALGPAAIGAISAGAGFPAAWGAAAGFALLGGALLALADRGASVRPSWR